MIDAHLDGFHYGFFPKTKLFLRNENLNNFVDVCSKPTLYIFFEFDTGFVFSCRIILRPIWLIWHNLNLWLHVS